MTSFYAVKLQSNNLAIYTSKASANAAAKLSGVEVLEDANGFMTVGSISDILSLHNKLAELLQVKTVQSVRQKEQAAAKLWEVINTVVVEPDADLIAAANALDGFEFVMEKKSKRVGAAKQKKDKGSDKRLVYSRDLVIERKVTKNPRREKTRGFDNWELMKNGKTVGDYITAGGHMQDLVHEVKRDRIALNKPEKE